MALIKCPECQKEISENAGSCPNCGYPINDENTEHGRISITNFRSKIHIIASCVAVVAAIILFVNGYKQTHNTTYRFYQQHYEECMDGYRENRQSAKLSSGYFKSVYNYISEEYKSMADDDKAKVDKYKKKGIVFYVIGGLLIVEGIVIAKKGGERSGTN